MIFKKSESWFIFKNCICSHLFDIKILVSYAASESPEYDILLFVNLLSNY